MQLIRQSVHEILKSIKIYHSNYKFTFDHKMYEYEYVGIATDARAAIIPTNDW